jgi:hypothetical protein
MVAALALGCGGQTSPGATDPTVSSPAVQPASQVERATPTEPTPVAIAVEPGADGLWDLAPTESLPPPAIAETPETDAPDERLLPEAFKVYVRGATVINHPSEGMEERTLPTVNDFKGRPGCYVACYSHDRRKGVYPVGGSIWVLGQLRVPGSYEGRICRPLRFERTDISRASVFREMCRMSVPACGEGCWAGGDTGGWFER